MRTKKKARPRVNSFGSLGSAPISTEPYSLDVEGEGLLDDAPNVGACLSLENESAAVSRVLTGVSSTHDCGSVVHDHRLSKTSSNSFDANYKLGDTNTVISSQTVESIVCVPDGEGFTQNSGGIVHLFPGTTQQITSTHRLGQRTNTNGPVSAEPSVSMQGRVASVNKGKRKMCDFYDEEETTTKIDAPFLDLLCTEEVATIDYNDGLLDTDHGAHNVDGLSLNGGLDGAHAASIETSRDAPNPSPSVNQCTRNPRASDHAVASSSLQNSDIQGPLTGPPNLNMQMPRQHRRRQVRMGPSSNRRRSNSTPRARPTRTRQGPPDAYQSLGRCDRVCHHCNARFWYDERLTYMRGGRVEYHKCCNGGKVRLENQREYPEYIKELFTDRHFMENIRAYNQMFAMTSLGAEVDDSINRGRGPYVFKISGQIYHKIGSLCPEEDKRPKFLQLYIYDTENEVANRLENFQKSGHGLRADIVENLIELLDEHNELVQLFITARNKMAEGNIPQFKVRLFGVVGSRQHELPTGDSIGAIVFEGGPDVETDFDVVIEQHDRHLKRVNKLNASYMSLQFPLIFFFGEHGYHLDRFLLGNQSSDDPPKKMSMKMYYSYELHDRVNEYTLLKRSGRLFQQYVVTAYCSIEQSRIDFIREHQDDIRNDYMAGLYDAISRGDRDGSDVGSRTILPSSFTGGPRYMYSHYLDALAICRAYGNPSFFITFTCNVNWPEIEEYMRDFPHVTVADRPDVVDRVFERKINDLVKFLRESKPFGAVEAVLYTIEFQKRGLPHCHLLLWIKGSHRIQAHEDIDTYISAELPDPSTDPEFYRVVTEFMIHGPCGLVNTSAPCMRGGDECTKDFPKPFCPATFIDAKGYVHYRRRDSGITTQKQNVSLDNGYVVPHNRALCLRFYAHINVEYCEWSMLIKYLFKYISKGTDRIVTHITRSIGDSEPSTSQRALHVDEIKNFQDARYIGPHEACWRILGFAIHSRDPPVQILAVHLENMQRVNFRSNQQLQSIVDSDHNKRTTLTEWLNYNTYNTDGQHLTYLDFPKEFTWHKDGKYWQRRRRTSLLAIGRLTYVHPSSGDAFYLRLLLSHQKGRHSFRHIRTVDGRVYPTNRAACEAMGLLGGDQEWQIALQEASFSATPFEMRNLFCQILIFCDVSSPASLLQSHVDSMSEDIPRILSEVLRIPNLEVSQDDLESGLMFELQAILNFYGKSVKDFGFELPPPHLLEILNNRAIMQERSYNRDLLRSESQRLIGQLNAEQRVIFEQVTQAVDNRQQKLIFVYGHGGTGKTFVWRTIISTLRSDGKIVLAVASSGIAALLLPSGQTAHSRFKIPLDLTDESMCSVKKKTQVAELLKQTDLIIWDEAPMNDRKCFEALDRTLRDIMDRPNSLFGGKPVILGGDFRQTLPVKKKATKMEIISASITQSYLWPYFKIFRLQQNMRLQRPGLSIEEYQATSEFSQWLLDVGNGSVGQPDEIDPANSAWIQIPDAYCIPDSSTAIRELIDFIYDEETLQAPNTALLQEKAIVCPKNETADIINSIVLDMLEGDTYTFTSVDEATPKTNDGGATELLYPQEYLNTLSFSGMPPSQLILKIGAPIMLLRNLNLGGGLCNGTRMIVTQIFSRLIQAKIITGTRMSEKVYIPRIVLINKEEKLPFVFKRKQFPVKLCYAMTINKSQGQSLNMIGVYLPEPVFGHGQLYVALSRATSPQGLKMLIRQQPGKNKNETKNVVYKDFLDIVTAAQENGTGF